MVPPERFELPTPRSEAECSDPLSYGGKQLSSIIHHIYDIIYKTLYSRVHKTYFMKYKDLILKNIKPIAYSIWILLFVFGYVFVQKTLKEGDIKVSPEETKKDVLEIKEYVVYIKLSPNSKEPEIRKRLENTNTVLDLFQQTQDEFPQLFAFEKTDYIDGTKIDEYNHQKKPDMYDWRVFAEKDELKTDISDTFKSLHIEDETIYSIELVKTANEI